MQSAGKSSAMARAALALSLLSLAAARGRDHLVEASVHEATGLLTGLSFSERMFADGRGPWGEVAGRASVAVNATLRALRDDEVADAITVHRLRDYFDVGVAVASFTVDARVDGLNASSICAANFSTANTPGLLYGEFHEVDDEHELQIGTAFHPSAAGIQQVLIVPCWKQKSESLGYYPVSADQFSTYPMADALLFMNATVSFRNSYGFLPALLAGLYPFNGVLALLYGAVSVCFSTIIYRHRESAIGMHYFVVTVLFLSTAECLSWFITFNMLNTSGQPACCPYPGLVVLSTMLRILAGMVARIATTLICLGYGILRPRISWPEVFVVSGLGLCYFIAVGALEISHISNQSEGDMRPPAVWELLAVTTNVCFGGWIFTSLALTRKNLAAFGQTAKLKMYTTLHRILVAYVLASFVLTAIEGAVYSDALSMSWTSIWLVWAANRLLFFCLLVVVASLWRPNPNTQLYAHMDQVPSREPVTPASIARAIELTQRVPSAADEETPKVSVGVAVGGTGEAL